MFLEFDVDENKSLDFGEALSLMSRFYNNSSEQDCLDAFVWFLTPHNGRSAAENVDSSFKSISTRDFPVFDDALWGQIIRRRS